MSNERPPIFTVQNPDQPLSDAAIAVLADMLLELVDQTEKAEAVPAPLLTETKDTNQQTVSPSRS